MVVTWRVMKYLFSIQEIDRELSELNKVIRNAQKGTLALSVESPVMFPSLPQIAHEEVENDANDWAFRLLCLQQHIVQMEYVV